MADYDKAAVAKIRFENGVRCLKSADVLLAEGDFKSAANRSYYAVFYAIRAVLALEGKDYKKHSAVISHFRKEYIKTGVFETTFSSVLSDLFEVRTDSDYDDFFILSKDEIVRQINNAKCFLTAVERYLANKSLFD